MKTILKSALVFILISALSINAFATTVGVQWDYLSRVKSELSINSFGVAKATGSATLQDDSCSVSVVVNLQQLKSNGWATIKTWSESGESPCIVSGSYAVPSGYDYRVETIATVYNGNGNKLEESITYSSIKNY